jgi:hypothetical protein
MIQNRDKFLVPVENRTTTRRFYNSYLSVYNKYDFPDPDKLTDWLSN